MPKPEKHFIHLKNLPEVALYKRRGKKKKRFFKYGILYLDYILPIEFAKSNNNKLKQKLLF